MSPPTSPETTPPMTFDFISHPRGWGVSIALGAGAKHGGGPRRSLLLGLHPEADYRWGSWEPTEYVDNGERVPLLVLEN